MKGIWETGLPACWRKPKSTHPTDAWFKKHGFPTFNELLALPEGVGARTLRQPTVVLPHSGAQPLGNVFTSRLADTTPSSAFSVEQGVGKSSSGMVGATAATAVGGSGPVHGHSGHLSTSSGGMALLAPTTMSTSPGEHGLSSATTCHDLPPGLEFAMRSPSIEFLLGGDPLIDE